MSKNSKGKQVQTYDKTALLGFVFTQNALKNLFATLAYKAITRIALSLSLSRCPHFLASLWAKFKGLFYSFCRSFISFYCRFYSFHRNFISSYRKFFLFHRSFISYFCLQKAFFRALCFFEIFKRFIFGFFALVIESRFRKNGGFCHFERSDPTGCKVQSHKSALNSLLKPNFRLR